jgi:hypothetical protein
LTRAARADCQSRNDHPCGHFPLGRGSGRQAKINPRDGLGCPGRLEWRVQIRRLAWRRQYSLHAADQSRTPVRPWQPLPTTASDQGNAAVLNYLVARAFRREVGFPVVMCLLEKTRVKERLPGTTRIVVQRYWRPRVCAIGAPSHCHRLFQQFSACDSSMPAHYPSELGIGNASAGDSGNGRRSCGAFQSCDLHAELHATSGGRYGAFLFATYALVLGVAEVAALGATP